MNQPYFMVPWIQIIQPFKKLIWQAASRPLEYKKAVPKSFKGLNCSLHIIFFTWYVCPCIEVLHIVFMECIQFFNYLSMVWSRGRDLLSWKNGFTLVCSLCISKTQTIVCVCVWFLSFLAQMCSIIDSTCNWSHTYCVSLNVFIFYYLWSAKKDVICSHNEKK